MTSAQQIESTIFQITINPDPNFSVGPKVGERPAPGWRGLLLLDQQEGHIGLLVDPQLRGQGPDRIGHG